MSVLRYPGAKTKAIPILDPWVPLENGTDRLIVSPFVGGASFELFLANHRQRRILAFDWYEPLINFWQTLKYQRHKLCNHLREVHETFQKLQPEEQRLQFYDWRDRLNDDEQEQKHSNSDSSDLDDPIARAATFYAVNRCSFSGTGCSGGFSADAASKCFSSNALDRLEDLSLDRIDFGHQHFADTIVQYPDALLFLDPPYYLTNCHNNLYGSRGNMHRSFDHITLYQLLCTHPRWILCYNNCDEIRQLYGGFPQIPTSWKYSMSTTKNKKRPDGQELVVVSPWVYEERNSSA